MPKHQYTTSAIVAEAVCGSQIIKIDGYSRMKELLGNNNYVTSIPFNVGGHTWVIRYYPNGHNKENVDYISVFLCLDNSSVAKDVKAIFKFSLLDKDGLPVKAYTWTSPVHTFANNGITNCWGYTNLMEKKDLEGSVHLRDDCFSISCDVTVMKEICSRETKGKQLVVVPPINLHQHLGDLLKNLDGADVAFLVGGERLWAHRNILAARSTVFKAELFGAMKEKPSLPIEIKDMEGNVFKSLLHFIYTDSLPETTKGGSKEGEAQADVVMAQRLLVAADRYNIERLKLICEEKLCRHIDSNMVATTLALAEQHSCHGLREACLEFLASPQNFKAVPSVLKELITRSHSS